MFCAILHTKNDIRISRDPICDLENVESLEFFNGIFQV